MGTINLKLTKTDSDFLKTTATMVSLTGNKFYYMPYWYEEISEGLYIQYTFESLPQEIKNYILSNRLQK